MADLSTIVLSKTVASSGGTLCWMSPELLDPWHFGSSGCPTRESDCYALGMVTYEVSWVHPLRWSLVYLSQVLSSFRPFYHIFPSEPAILSAILRGERPGKPPDPESLGFSDTLWGLMQLCWSESISTRPPAQRLLDYFSPASLTWVPPLMYPVIPIDTFGAKDSDSSDFSRTSSGNSMCEVPSIKVASSLFLSLLALLSIICGYVT